MTRRQRGDKPLSAPMMVSLLTHHIVYASLGLNELSGLFVNFLWSSPKSIHIANEFPMKCWVKMLYPLNMHDKFDSFAMECYIRTMNFIWTAAEDHVVSFPMKFIFKAEELYQKFGINIPYASHMNWANRAVGVIYSHTKDTNLYRKNLWSRKYYSFWNMLIVKPDYFWLLLSNYTSTQQMPRIRTRFYMIHNIMETFFRVTGPLCGEFIGHRWIPLTRASDAEFLCFLWSAPEQTVV